MDINCPTDQISLTYERRHVTGQEVTRFNYRVSLHHLTLPLLLGIGFYKMMTNQFHIE